MILNNTKVIAFDADDTLWENESLFYDFGHEFCKQISPLVSSSLSMEDLTKMLSKIEIKNIENYGYGMKSFMLSMIETACNLKLDNHTPRIINNIIEQGKSIIDKPVKVIDGVRNVLSHLKDKFHLIIVTKGDLLDQEKKLQNSDLESFFDDIVVISEKNEAKYLSIIDNLEIRPDQFLMIGNSLKSDVLPVVNIGSQAIHIPSRTTWEFEKVEISSCDREKFIEYANMTEFLNILK